MEVDGYVQPFLSFIIGFARFTFHWIFPTKNLRIRSGAHCISRRTFLTATGILINRLWLLSSSSSSSYPTHRRWPRFRTNLPFCCKEKKKAKNSLLLNGTCAHHRGRSPRTIASLSLPVLGPAFCFTRGRLMNYVKRLHFTPIFLLRDF